MFLKGITLESQGLPRLLSLIETGPELGWPDVPYFTGNPFYRETKIWEAVIRKIKMYF